MNENIKIIIQDYESAVCKIVLYELHNLATYSLLSTFTGEQLRTIIEALRFYCW